MSGCIFTIYVSKDEAVCCEVKTHVGSFRFARFMKKVLGAISRFMRPKTKLFAVQTHVGSFLPAKFTQKVLGAFSRFLCPNT